MPVKLAALLIAVLVPIGCDTILPGSGGPVAEDEGLIRSNTLSFKKPVRVATLNLTNYSASKRVMISDDRFVTTAAYTSANASNRTLSIRKTGGNFGRRLVERIAHKQVAEKKPQTERIASQKAQRQVSTNFDAQVQEALQKGRLSYLKRFRWPLERVGMFPGYLNMSSSTSQILVAATLANQSQISTGTLPPAKNSSNEVSVQVHETAVNNFAPVLLAGLILRQQAESEPVQLIGDVPPWLKKLAAERSQEQAASRSQSPQLNSANEPTADAEQSLKFQPWSIQFNADHPLSVSFHDSKVTLRVRFAEMRTEVEDQEEDNIFRNWDLLVTYEVIQRGDLVVLRREGDIEALPTGFDPEWFDDPRWDDKLSGRQVSIRNNLEKNINKRAEQGTGFPREIAIPALEFTQENGTRRSVDLTQLQCDEGWLTLGYRVP